MKLYNEYNVSFLTRHANATSMTSVRLSFCLSVYTTLANCECNKTWKTALTVVLAIAACRSAILNFAEEDKWHMENVEFCTLAAVSEMVQTIRMHVALSQQFFYSRRPSEASLICGRTVNKICRSKILQFSTETVQHSNSLYIFSCVRICFLCFTSTVRYSAIKDYYY